MKVRVTIDYSNADYFGEIKAMIRMISPNKFENSNVHCPKVVFYGGSQNSNIIIKQIIQLLLGGTQLIF
jgi:hypothetical protein